MVGIAVGGGCVGATPAVTMNVGILITVGVTSEPACMDEATLLDVGAGIFGVVVQAVMIQHPSSIAATTSLEPKVEA
jgi:hypothetical protein